MELPAWEMSGRPGSGWVWILSFGAVTIAWGVLTVVWPGQTLSVLSVLLGIYLIVLGLWWLSRLLWSPGTDSHSSARLLRIAGGLLSMGTGTLLWIRGGELMVLAAGIFWVLWGLMVGATSILRRADSDGSWQTVSGVASVTVGIVALAWPDVTSLVMAWLAGAWLIVEGTIRVGLGLEIQRSRAEHGGP